MVATEVRNLAMRSETASKEIESLLENLNYHMIDVSDSSKIIHDEIENINNLVNDLSGLQSNIESNFYNIIDKVKNDKHISFTQIVMMDHVIWKAEIYNRIINHKEVIKLDDLVDHKDCRLGKWYFSDGKQLFKNNKNFTKLDKPHFLVHSSGYNALKFFKEENYKKAFNELDIMEKASIEVLRLLNMMSF